MYTVHVHDSIHSNTIYEYFIYQLVHANTLSYSVYSCTAVQCVQLYTVNACLDRVFTGPVYRHEFSSQDNFGTMLLFTCTICAYDGIVYSDELTLPIGRLHPCFSSTRMKHNKNVYVNGLPGMKCPCNCNWKPNNNIVWFPVSITGL